MQRIAILGSKTLLAEHLVKALNDTFPNVTKTLWDHSTDGMDALNNVLVDAELVINLHEVQDFSVVPEKNKLQEHNVEFVRLLIAKCEEADCSRIIHLSSVYLQCSAKWPNVYGREVEDFAAYRAECPFPEYCESKFIAEQMIRNSGLQSIIVRLGPLFGEGDRCSLVCDSILATSTLGFVPIIGDQNQTGVMQFTYAGNAAYALLKCAERFFEDVNDHETEDFHTETVIVCDQTPLKDVYTLLLEPMAQKEGGQTGIDEKKDGEGKADMKDTNGSIRVGSTRIPFFAFYPFYFLTCMFVRVFNNVFGVKSVLAKMPSPSYIYMVLRHWTFFADYKLRLFFDYVPEFDWDTSLRLSRAYYSQLKPDQIDGFSWMPHLN